MACEPMREDRRRAAAMQAAFDALVEGLRCGDVRLQVNALTGEPYISGWKETAAAAAGWEIGCVSAKLMVEHPDLLQKQGAAVQRAVKKSALAHNRGHR